jgi:hypothetical protein
MTDQLALSIINTLEKQISKIKDDMEAKLNKRNSGEDELNATDKK